MRLLSSTSGQVVMLTRGFYNRHAPFLQSATGQIVEKQLYAETMAEMGNYLTVPLRLMPKA